MSDNSAPMLTFADIGKAMKAGGYTNFTEFMDSAVDAGFHDDENIDVAGFIAAGAPRPTNQENQTNA